MSRIARSFIQYFIPLYPLIFLISLLCYELTHEINYLLIGFTICYVIVLIHTIKLSGIFSIYAVYLYTSAFFLYDCFFLSLFTEKDFLIQSFPKTYAFDIETGLVFIISCYITLYITHLTYIFVRKEKYIKMSKIVYKQNYSLKKLGLVLFFLFLFPVLYKILLQIQYIMKMGYISIYTGALSEIDYPFWTAGAFIFFNAGYYIILSSKPEKREFIFYSVIFFIVYLFDSLKGGRGNVLALLIILLAYYSKVYDVKIRFRKLIYAAIFILFITVVLGNLRNTYGSDTTTAVTESVPIGQLITDALWSQTNTRAVPMLIMKGDLQYHEYPFVFYPLTNLIVPHFYPIQHGATRLVLEKFNNPSLVLIANVSLEAGLSGYGYDSAFLGEAYEIFGYFGIVLFSILVGIVICFFDYSKLNFGYYITPLLFEILLSIPRLPRKSILGFLSNFNLLIMIYIILIVSTVFIKTLRDRRKS